MKRFISIVIISLLCLCGISCEGERRNKIAGSYSRKDIEKAASDYLKEKYQLTNIAYGKIGTFDETYGGMDATVSTGFKGFIIEANEFKVYMAFELDKSYQFSDDRQSSEIESELKQKLKEVYSGEAYLSMAYKKATTYNDDKKLYGYNDYLYSYTERYEDDLATLFLKDEHMHEATIYIEGQQKEETIGKIKESLNETKVSYKIYQLRLGTYNELQQHFDDYEYMEKVLKEDGYAPL